MRKSFLFLTIAGAVAFSPAAAKWATDGWFFANDVKAPNVTRENGNFVLTYSVISAAKANTTKKVNFLFTYTQVVPGLKKSNGKTCDQTLEFSGSNDCDVTTTRVASAVLANLKPGERRTGKIRIGEAGKGKECSVSGSCSGMAKIWFVNNNGVKPTMTVKWKSSQNGNAEDLEVQRTAPKA